MTSHQGLATEHRSNEDLDQLASPPKSVIEIRGEILAPKPDASPDRAVRTVTKNARTIMFDADSGRSES